MLETDGLGILSTHARSTKGKVKSKAKSRTRKELQKAKYFFVEEATRTASYADYFNSDVDVEKRMMGLSDLVRDLLTFRHLTHFTCRMFGPGCAVKKQKCH